MLPKIADIVIIGGGVMGASTAYHLARRGAGRVLLLEKGPFFGLGATGTCAGGIRHQFSAEINIRLSTLSIQMLERFPEEIEQDINLHFCGYLFTLSSDKAVADFRRNVALQHSLGIATEWLDRDEIGRRAPLIDLDAEPAVIAGTYYDRDGLCDPNSVVQGYVKQARRLGATLLNNIAVTGIRTEGGKVTGVDTTQGRVSAPLVLLAAGPWSAPLAATAGVDLPLVPLRRQIAVTRPLGIPRDMPFILDFDQSLYFHYETGGVLTGMSNPDETPGEKLDVDPEWTGVHFDHAIARMPVLAQAQLLTQWAGLYEVTPDSQPIVGALPVDGLYTCAGFSGHGFMQGPICGLLMAEAMLDGRAETVDVSSLGYERFTEGRKAPEWNVV